MLDARIATRGARRAMCDAMRDPECATRPRKWQHLPSGDAKISHPSEKYAKASGSTEWGGPTRRRVSGHKGGKAMSASVASAAVSGRHWRSIRAARRHISTPMRAARCRSSTWASVPLRLAKRRAKARITFSGIGIPKNIGLHHSLACIINF